ncbi:MAG TPA: copper amine oxidase N-terminal domain-containing protein [Candidatus Eremiobacteraceae bacterium]|nr:copper amine oxidase N-terminal domain-containing protein [Candidatus Eremiobacteraceae bacterium]
MSAQAPRVVVDGSVLSASAVVTIKEKTFVSLRTAAAALNADVAFDGKAKTVTLTTVVRQVIMRIGDPIALLNGQRVVLNAPAQLVSGRVMLPLRSLAVCLGARVTFDRRAHRVEIASVDNSAPSGGGTSSQTTQSQTLQGTVTRVDISISNPAVYIGADRQEYRIAVPPSMKIQFRETRGTIAGTGSIAQVRPGDTLIAVQDRSGALVSIADIFTGYTGTVASVAGWSMVLTNGRVVDGDKSATAVSRDGQSAALGDLQAGDMVTVRADPKSGKVRDVVALSPAAPGSTATVAPQPDALRIDTVTDNADRALRAGQVLRVAASGSRGANVLFDIGDLVDGISMPEVQPGRYEGTFDVQVGTNLINAPIVVRAVKGSVRAQAVAADPLTIITTPPSVREVAPAAGASVNNRRPSLFATFATLGDRGMQADSLRLWIDGIDVSSAAVRTPEYISYLPQDDLGDGIISVRLAGVDTAGNPLEFKWSFVISGS